METTVEFFFKAAVRALQPSSPMSLLSRLMLVRALFFSKAHAKACVRGSMADVRLLDRWNSRSVTRFIQMLRYTCAFCASNTLRTTRQACLAALVTDVILW